MRIEKDISDLNDFIEDIPGEIKDAIVEVAAKAISEQKARSNYQNHTWNLRNAPGYVVTVDGKEVARDVPADGTHGEAEAKTDKILDQADKSGTSVVFADGMEYASFVSSKGYDVLDTALLHADRELNKKSRE